LYMLPADFFVDSGVSPPTWQFWGPPDTPPATMSPWIIDTWQLQMSTSVLGPEDSEDTGWLGVDPAISPPTPYNPYSPNDWWDQTCGGGGTVGYDLYIADILNVYKWDVTDGFKFVT
jgi:hypothetical protein